MPGPTSHWDGAPAQRGGLKGRHLGGQPLLLLPQTCIQMSSRDVWVWWWFLGNGVGFWEGAWAEESHDQLAVTRDGAGMLVWFASAAHALLRFLGELDFPSSLLYTSCRERLSPLLISTLVRETV